MIDAADQLKMIGIDPREETRFLVRKRDGRNEEFNEARIFMAIECAFKAVHGIVPDQPLPEAALVAVLKTADAVAERVLSGAIKGEPLEVERIQDAVEEQLMRDGHWQVARSYILYRDERRRARVEREKRAVPGPSPPAAATSAPEQTPAKAPSCFQIWAAAACRGLEDRCSMEDLAQEALRLEQQGIKDPEKAMELAADSRLTADPACDTVAARLFLRSIYRQALPQWVESAEVEPVCRRGFSDYIHEAIHLRLLAPEMADFDLEFLAGGLRLEHDAQFSAAGLRLLSADFLLRDQGRLLEPPQYFWMRLAMGLALREGARADERALEFYEALSSFAFVPSTPVLFNAGTAQPHLAVCYAATGWNDLEHITAQPGGRMSRRMRAGLTCSWLEPWHGSMPDFLARPRPGEPPWEHDLNKGAWIPDLFLQRVREGGRWTLFDALEVPDLHRLFGAAFQKRFLEYEARAARGEMKEFRQVPALELWREILASLAETGQPWLAFKDAANLRSLQDPAEAVRSALLGAGALLPTPAACSLGAINLAAHVDENGLDAARLGRTAAAAMRMLDNALDLSAFPSPALRAAARAERAAGLGITGFQEALYQLRLPYASAAAAEFADRGMELVSYCAILESTALARERGPCPAYAGSKWSCGLLPADTLAFLEEQRGRAVAADRPGSLDWAFVRDSVKRHGMRNSAVTAIGPALEGSWIAGVTPSIEPAARTLFGEGAGGARGPWNLHLVEDLRRLNLWDDAMREELRRNEHSLQQIERIPPSLRDIYRTAFEIEPRWLIECAARRQKWMDQGQSLTLFATDASFEALSELYLLAWERGLLTTNRLRVPEPPPLQKPPWKRAPVQTSAVLPAVPAAPADAPSAGA
ncbi:MAG: ribonucleoside-diphosphate reductase subunit alpha [Verrucomicrobiota bacterium]|jgi:ribonucleoside-diphosphate reductase alpha chain